MKLGTIRLYDPHTMTAELISYDGAEEIRDAGIMMSSYNPIGGGGSFTPPVPGATCLYDTISGETIIFGYYAPINGVGGNEEPTINDPVDSQYKTTSITSTYVDRSGASLPGKTTPSGGSSTTTAGGLATIISDKFASISISPIFHATMNAINEFFDIMCTNLRFRSPGVDVVVVAGDKSGGSNPTTVNVVVRQSSAERADNVIPAINLVMGKDTGNGVINLKINGNPFIKVDIERNVELRFKKFTLIGESVDASAISTEYLLP